MKVRERTLLLASLLLLVSVGGIVNLMWQMPRFDQILDPKAILQVLILLVLFGAGLVFSILELVRQEIRSPLINLTAQVARLKERQIDAQRFELTGSKDIDLLASAFNDFLGSFQNKGDFAHLLAESFPDTIFLFDREGCVLFGNLNAARQWNYRGNEIIGKRQEKLFPPNIAERHKQIIKQILETGQPVSFDVHEMIGKRHCWIDTRMIPVLDANGRISAILSISRDITEHKRADEVLRESENRYRGLFAGIPDGAIIHNAEGYILDANEAVAQRLEIRRAALLGRQLAGFVMPDDAAKIRSNAQVTLAGRPRIFETTYVAASGKTIPAEVHEHRIQWMDGQAILSISRDITERKRAEESLRKAHDELEQRIEERTKDLHSAKLAADAANRAKSDFLANMSHELRTPLSAIIGFSELLEEKLFGDLNPKQAEYVTDIFESAQHLLSLINDILDLAKIEAGKTKLEISSFPIATLLEDSLIMMKEKCLRQGIRLVMDIADPVKTLVISADERKLKQIMYNLLSNAVKFTPGAGAITVSANVISDLAGQQSQIKNRQSAILISVSDTGIGIPKEYQGRIFEEFFQVAISAKGKPTGTGLGLSLVKRMVEQHGGRVWVESPSTPLPPSPGGSGEASRAGPSTSLRAGDEGKGCTFRFAIPLPLPLPPKKQAQSLVRIVRSNLVAR